MALTRDEILAANDLATEVVNVPEWGGDVIVRTMNGAERDEFESSLFVSKQGGGTEQNLKNFRAKLVAMTVVDEQGARLFKDASDVDALGAKSALALSRVAEVAQRLNGIGAKEQDAIAKN